jgi:hypothetical protein
MYIEFIAKQKDAQGRTYKVIFDKLESIVGSVEDDNYLKVNGVEVEGSYNDLIRIMRGDYAIDGSDSFYDDHYVKGNGLSLWRL